MWRIIINGPGYFDTTYDLPEGATHVGRAEENDIVLSGDLVSRRHARFRVSGGQLEFEDLGSRNGSRVNGNPVAAPVNLQIGDTVGVGENTLAIRQPSPVEDAETELVDLGAGRVRRVSRGVNIDRAVILAKDVRESVVLRLLDNVGSVDTSRSPFHGEEPFVSEEDSGTRWVPSTERPPVNFDSLLLLYKVAEKLSTAPSLQAFLDETADRVMERVNATTAVILLRHPAGQMVPATVRHRGQLARGEVPISDAVVDAALAQGAALAVADVKDDLRFAQRESVILYNVDQVLCVPIGHGAPYLGVLYLNKSAEAEGSVEPLLDLCTAVAHLIATGLDKFRPERDSAEERLRRVLERFHPPAVVDRRVLEVRSGTAAAMDERNVAVVVAELAGFSALAKRLPPKRVTELLSEFLQRMTGVIFSFEGTVAKFLGDSVMGIFGSPYSRGDDALRALRTALALRNECERTMAKCPEDERCALKVGVHVGKAWVGTVGSEARLDFTGVGEALNVAAWLTATAAPGQVLATGKLLATVGGRFDVVPLGQRELPQPGVNGAVRVAVFDVVEEDPRQATNPGPG